MLRVLRFRVETLLNIISILIFNNGGNMEYTGKVLWDFFLFLFSRDVSCDSIFCHVKALTQHNDIHRPFMIEMIMK